MQTRFSVEERAVAKAVLQMNYPRTFLFGGNNWKVDSIADFNKFWKEYRPMSEASRSGFATKFLSPGEREFVLTGKLTGAQLEVADDAAAGPFISEFRQAETDAVAAELLRSLTPDSLDYVEDTIDNALPNDVLLVDVFSGARFVLRDDYLHHIASQADAAGLDWEHPYRISRGVVNMHYWGPTDPRYFRLKIVYVCSGAEEFCHTKPGYGYSFKTFFRGYSRADECRLDWTNLTPNLEVGHRWPYLYEGADETDTAPGANGSWPMRLISGRAWGDPLVYSAETSEPDDTDELTVEYRLPILGRCRFFPN